MPTELNGKLFKKYKSTHNTFIETGSYIGDGIQSALNAKFDNIYSMEISPHHYEITKQRFLTNENVNVILGDSRLLLDSILHKNKSNIVFWLDAHCSGGMTEGDDVLSTLNTELNIVQKQKVKDCVIILDDMNPELIDLYSIKLQNMFDVIDIVVENGYQEHTGHVFLNSILVIIIK